MNVELLRKIAAVIQEKPAEFDMGDFASGTDCGTTHCIGGWACVLTGIKLEDVNEANARNALGLTGEEGERLFYPNDWPREEGCRYLVKFGGWHATPEQAAARIEHFIETGGRE